jgi:hypothetical protein
MKNLGDSSFYDCTSFISIEIPSSLTSIPYGCFYRCKKLQCILFLSSIKSLNEYAFSEGESLKNIEILSSVISISKGYFMTIKILLIFTNLQRFHLKKIPFKIVLIILFISMNKQKKPFINLI